MGYEQTLDYLYGLQRFGIKLGLENIRLLLERLGHPERDFGIVHVAGTNGKGSVTACLAEILTRAGYRTGHYSSPHLHSFTERIRVDGTAIAEPEVVRLTEELRLLCQDIPVTFFEFTTALALLYFSRRGVDFAVLEVGMGGRLDATNVVMPRLCVITPISLDHAEHLGADLVSIAAEKGGIIKDRVPVVIGRQAPEGLQELRRLARERQASTVIFGADFSAAAEPGGFSYLGLDVQLSGLRPALAGAHQHENLSLSLCAAELLRRQGSAIPEGALRAGVEQVRWPGRLEWWQGRREVLLDGAHNEGGARALAAYLATLEISGVRWVVGLKADKAVASVLAPLLPLVAAVYCTVPPVDQPVAAERLAAEATAAGRPARVFASPADALQAALTERRRGEIVLVAGSLFLVAAAREALSGMLIQSP
ncbi:bifunctional folylpolyglutamate synthase/dihydrofolate synthase [Desulfuromonas versatilis]|uniref:Dihydrofolate synthase/folylpolyglutamate synthase n=1 Tax=Desulfuromonas versatilis TaxID=2802975 RepID=A0ABM8HUB7_9BACT|nr:folylpolyglutamate synthase/dihydrofolate synthase family protein [Desulfuromonas versatilis]BCR04083.1 bifunctional folylpolyglutamate synthase/dihydrofolate synthase [Desulfuromonas versatilis]